MSSRGEAVNPLRPYYVPPSIGDSVHLRPPPATPAGSSGGAFPSHPGGSAPTASTAWTTGASSSARRDPFLDVDFKTYMGDEPSSVMANAKELVDGLIWRYTSVLMAQPFEVAKTLLQVHSLDAQAAAMSATSSALSGGGGSAPLSPRDELRQRYAGHRPSAYEQDQGSDSEGEEPAYFTSNHPSTPTPSARGPRPPSYTGRQSSTLPQPLPSPRLPKQSSTPAHHLALRQPDSVLEVIGQLWQKEGSWGVWKGSNATFLYTVLQSLMENWSRSVLSAAFNVPDLGLAEDVDRMMGVASEYPWASLFVAAAAAVVTGLALAPLDLVRTRLVLSPTSRPPRRTLAALRALPSYLCPPLLVIPTALHALVHPLLTLSTPLVLRSKFLIDRELSPTSFSVAKFCTSTVALFVKLPLETVLRRGQAAVLSDPSYLRALDGENAGPTLETIVPVGKYKGVLGTAYSIVTEEGSRAVVSNKPSAATAGAKKKAGRKLGVAEVVYRKGQGMDGLWRGWKVSWWGLVGLWTAAVVGGGGEGEF